MAEIITMPRLGLMMTEGTIGSWLKSVGEKVEKGEPLFEIETDKLTSTIESTASGTILKIIADEGQTVPIQEPVAIVGNPGEDIEISMDSNFRTDSAFETTESNNKILASPRAKHFAKTNDVDLANVTGTGENGAIKERDVISFLSNRNNKKPETVKTTPLAGKIAKEYGVDVSNISTNGRILSEDVVKYIIENDTCSKSAPNEEVRQMNGMRKAIARNMVNSHLTSPMVSFDLSVDMTEMRKFKEQLAESNIKVSYTVLLVKVLAKALLEYPELNCVVEDDSIRYKHYVNMGIAVALDDGLIVPNIPNVENKTFTQISTEMQELVKQAKEKRLTQDRLVGGTFTITNLGMYGIESFTPIINQPEVAILGVTTIEDRVVARNGEITIRPMMTLSLTADHRVVDGAKAAQFLQRVKNLIEKPALLLA